MEPCARRRCSSSTACSPPEGSSASGTCSGSACRPSGSGSRPSASGNGRTGRPSIRWGSPSRAPPSPAPSTPRTCWACWWRGRRCSR
ncbi:hypothetical protein D7Y04_09685 [Corallococcus sp. AB038B]|nr:hypothetical protein D7Y04_09685 [Corallococcus sp. AB038B]